jgi:hypothetical protein
MSQPTPATVPGVARKLAEAPAKGKAKVGGKTVLDHEFFSVQSAQPVVQLVEPRVVA